MQVMIRRQRLVLGLREALFGAWRRSGQIWHRPKCHFAGCLMTYGLDPIGGESHGQLADFCIEYLGDYPHLDTNPKVPPGTEIRAHGL